MAGVAPLRRALDAFGQDAGGDEDDILRWLWLAWLVAGDLWDDEMWHELATRAVRLGRESGALTVLPLALGYRAVVHLHAGEFAAAAALIEEADAITEATGIAPVKLPIADARRVARRRGRRAAADRAPSVARRDRARRGTGDRRLRRTRPRVLYNGLGRYEAALARAAAACEYDDLGVFGFVARRAGRGGRPQRRPRGGRCRRCDASRNERARSAPTGRSASRPGHARC